jgi:hypothetical protein
VKRIQKLIAFVLLTAWVGMCAEVRLNNKPILGLAFRGDGVGFFKIDEASTNGCNEGWILVPDNKVMSLILTAKTIGSNLAIAVFDNASPLI